MPVLSDDERVALVKRMRSLPPLRNINAMHAWMSACRPDAVPMFEAFLKSAAEGHQSAKTVIIMMMASFAAGRVYEEANPNAPKDPDGY